MDLTEYRTSPLEQQRSSDLLRLMPSRGKRALDIGARDGYFSLLMAERFEEVVALDLSLPTISHPRIHCIMGNAAQMDFADNSFDFVFCAEVLEHVSSTILGKVCEEIERVASNRMLIGVPYKQDIRIGRTTCGSCGKVNPPWGHVNSFDERRLSKLFRQCKADKISFVGENSARTNYLSAVLMNFAGNPYGTYDQEEPCLSCGKKLSSPSGRGIPQRIATRLAFMARRASELMGAPHANWIHVLLQKSTDKQE